MARLKNNPVRIALADDDEDDREFFGEALGQLRIPFELDLYKNGMELVMGLCGNGAVVPDLVFLDLNMPVMSGISALREIRAIEAFRKIPVIAIYSTSGSEADQERTFSLGADAYICKPSDYGKLKAVLQRVLDIDWHQREGTLEDFVIKAD